MSRCGEGTSGPDPRGEPPSGFRWCGDPARRCRCRLMLSSKHELCEHCRPPVSHQSGPRRPGDNAKRYAVRKRRELLAGLAWEGI